MKEPKKNRLIEGVVEARREAEELGGKWIDLSAFLAEFSVGGLHGDPKVYQTRVAAVRVRIKFVEGTPKLEHSIDFPTGLAGLTLTEALQVQSKMCSALALAGRLRVILPESWEPSVDEISGLEDWLRGEEE